MSSTMRAQHLRAHAIRMQAFAYRFRHGGYNACAAELAARAEHYLEQAALLETTKSRPAVDHDYSRRPAAA